MENEKFIANLGVPLQIKGKLSCITPTAESFRTKSCLRKLGESRFHGNKPTINEYMVSINASTHGIFLHRLASLKRIVCANPTNLNMHKNETIK